MPRLDLVGLSREGAVVSALPTPAEPVEDEGRRQSDPATDAEIADAHGQDHPEVYGAVWRSSWRPC